MTHKETIAAVALFTALGASFTLAIVSLTLATLNKSLLDEAVSRAFAFLAVGIAIGTLVASWTMHL